MKCAFLKVLALNALPAWASEFTDDTTVTASPVDIFTQRTADHYNTDNSSTSLLYFLQQQNGIQSRTNGSSTLSIRGSLSADRTLTLFGFAPMQAGDGSGPAFVLLGDELFDTLYVYKGPASLYFGSKATGGAFRFLPLRRKQHRVRLLAASFDQYNGDVQITAIQTPDHHLQFTIFAEDYKNSYEHKSGHGYSKGRWRPNYSTWYRSSASYFYKNSYTSVLWGKKHGTTPSALGFAINEYDQNALLATHYNEVTLHKNHTAKFQISNLNTENNNLQGGFDSKITNDVFNSVLHFESKITDSFLNSLQLQFNEATLKNDYGSPTKYSENEFDVGIQQVHFISSLQIEPQIKFLDEYQTWIKGLTVSKDLYYAAYSEGFRSPVINALHLDGPENESNPDLKPEESKQIELGIKHTNFQIKAFHIKYEDMFKTNFDGTKYQTVNEDNAKSSGVEVNLQAKRIAYDVKFQATYMRSEDSVGQDLPLSPRLQLLYGLSYYYGVIEIQPQIRTWYKYYLQNYTTGLERSDNWTTTDLYFHTFGFKNWKASLGVENIFEEQKTFDIGYPESLRRFVVQYQYQF